MVVPTLFLRGSRYFFFVTVFTVSGVTALISACGTATQGLNQQFSQQAPTTALRPYRGLKVGMSYTLSRRDQNQGQAHVQNDAEDSEPESQQWRFSGEELQRFRFDVSQAGLPNKRVWLNAQGALVKQQQGAHEVRFEPHDCQRTRTRCEFTRIDPRLGTEYFVREGRFDGEFWQYRLYVVKTERELLEERGRMRFDMHGFPVFIEREFADGRRKLWQALSAPAPAPVQTPDAEQTPPPSVFSIE